MDRLEIVDISTLPRGKPLETPLCKKRIRAWNPKVQSVARSPKTPVTTADDDVAADSHAPTVAKAPRQKTPQSIAPSFSQKVQSVARSTKTPDSPVDGDVATDTDYPVPPVARQPCQNTPLLIAPSFSQLEIVDISTLLKGKPLETPLGKKRKRARNPEVQSGSRSPKAPDPPADDDAAPATNSSLPPEASSSTPKKTPPSTARNNCQKVKRVGRSTKKMVTPVVGAATPATNSWLSPAAGFSCRRRNRPIHKLEIVHISTLPRSIPLKTLRKNRIAWSPKVQSVARSSKKLDPPVDDDGAPDTNSSLPTTVSLSLPKNTPLSLAPNTCKKRTRRKKEKELVRRLWLPRSRGLYAS